MRVSWKPTDYFNFQEYLLFRQDDSSKITPQQPLKITTDTTFNDTIYGKTVRFSDTGVYAFRYRIKIRDMFDKEGNVFGYVRATACPPSLVKTFFEFKNTRSDTITRDDTISIALSLANETRNLKSLAWAVGKPDSVVREVELDSTRKTAADTISYSWEEEGDFKIFVMSKDAAGVEWMDSMQVSVIKDFPRIKIAEDTLVLTNGKVRLHATADYRFSKISKWEWDIGNTGRFVQVSTSDTIITAPPSEHSGYLCILRATNDDGYSAQDTMRIQSRKVFIHAPLPSGSVSGVYNVYGVADPAVSGIQIKIGDNDWESPSGIADWSAEVETRLLYPNASADISVKIIEDGVPDLVRTIPVTLSNPDPIIGCWSGPSGDFCLNQGGWITGYPFGADRFPDGWLRFSDNTIAITRSVSPITITITWIDYNTMVASGTSWSDGTYTRQ
jgi:hypothetical protein